MTKAQAKIFEESIAWIRKNPWATIHDVPLRLLDCWSYETSDEYEPSAFYLSIFAFGYFQSQLRLLGDKASLGFEVGQEELIDLFELWQLKVGLAELHARTELKFSAMPLFDFPPNEGLQAWSTALGMSRRQL